MNPLPPTDNNVASVKISLSNMIDFNNLLYTYGNAKIMNAFVLLTIQDNNDLGLQVGLNLLCGAFWAIGGEFGPAGSVAANFLTGVVALYGTNTPPSINGIFSNLITRFQETSAQLNRDLEDMHKDTITYWNNTYSGSFQTPFGNYTSSFSLSQLANQQFPSKSDPAFGKMMDAASFALDQSLWWILLKNRYHITRWLTAQKQKFPTKKYPNNEAMEANARGWYSSHPAYWNTWTLETDGHWIRSDSTYYNLIEHSIGGDPHKHDDGALNAQSCAYLFIDSSDNYIINSRGLFYRKAFFNDLGFPVQETKVPKF